MSAPSPTVYQPSDLSEEVINGKKTKNALVTNPQTGGLSFGKIPPNNNGVSEGGDLLKIRPCRTWETTYRGLWGASCLGKAQR